ncbi:MAG TPA: YceI family protein [Rubrivivax sp.]|nr:YceI family protein [Rubrivivax sp.]
MKALPLCLLALAASAAAQPALYRLDPEHSFVYFEVLHFGTSTLRGRFGVSQGEVELDRSAQRGAVSLRIATAAVDTGMPAFDARLREADLLGSEAWPEATFVASEFRFDGAEVSAVRGELGLRGVRQPIELRALRFGCHTHPQLQREVCGGDFEGELPRRSDFGAGYGLPFVANRVRLRIQVEGIRQ